MTSCRVAIVGAGPYGLSAAAYLRAARVDVRVFGRAMEFWDQRMPAGMLLRSYWEGSHIADPGRSLTLDSYQAACARPLPRPVRLEDFVAYGRWFQRHVVPDLDQRRVLRVGDAAGGFQLLLDDGETVHAERVVVAAGIGPFAWRPPEFQGLPRELTSHSSDHRDLARFAGQRVAVIGGGQSALESAALLHEAHAEVEVIARAAEVRWLRYGTPLHTWLHAPGNPVRRVLYPPSDIGPPGLNWIVDTPALFRRMPRRAQPWITRRTTRPAGAGWLRSRLADVRISTGRAVIAAAASGARLRLVLSDGSQHVVDHGLLATGYRVDISRYPFLPPELVSAVRLVDGHPQLTAGFETSRRGLHILGAPAVVSFGPLMRFVAGSGYAARALTLAIAGRAIESACEVPVEVHSRTDRASTPAG